MKALIMWHRQYFVVKKLKNIQNFPTLITSENVKQDVFDKIIKIENPKHKTNKKYV